MLAIGRVGWLEVALILALALAPVAIALLVALWARIARTRGPQE